jgi:hypothetical protein
MVKMMKLKRKRKVNNHLRPHTKVDFSDYLEEHLEKLKRAEELLYKRYQPSIWDFIDWIKGKIK